MGLRKDNITLHRYYCEYCRMAIDQIMELTVEKQTKQPGHSRCNQLQGIRPPCPSVLLDRSSPIHKCIQIEIDPVVQFFAYTTVQIMVCLSIPYAAHIFSKALL